MRGNAVWAAGLVGTLLAVYLLGQQQGATRIKNVQLEGEGNGGTAQARLTLPDGSVVEGSLMAVPEYFDLATRLAAAEAEIEALRQRVSALESQSPSFSGTERLDFLLTVDTRDFGILEPFSQTAVYRNGILATEGADYTVEATGVRFLDPIPVATDRVALIYTSAPTADLGGP
jgi:hypothetical protein